MERMTVQEVARPLTRDERRADRERWERLGIEHARLEPYERRALSWARTAAFSKAVLLLSGSLERAEPTAARPFVFWVLGAVAEVEGFLLESGFFEDFNFLKREPTEVVVLGGDLEQAEAGEPSAEQGCAPRIRMMSYADASSAEIRKPDVVIFFMPALDHPSVSSTHSGAGEREVPALLAGMPRNILGRTAGAPIVVTTRFKVSVAWQKAIQSALKEQLFVCPMRSLFSALPTEKDTNLDYDDNGWLVCLRDADALEAFFRLGLRPAPAESRDPEDRIPACFWGIVDLKFDPTMPVLQRTKVLETGDGRTSRFSNDGSEIPKRFRSRYRLEDGAGSGRHTVVSNNKKLTHDLMVMTGYQHLVPNQVCLPRVYTLGLAKRILDGLRLGNEDLVMLKLCNRSRAAGILPVPADELDEVLEEILNPPEDLEDWFLEKESRGNAETTELAWGSFEETVRHWWSNECPHFAAERCCVSQPVEKDGLLYDPTMRVAFALRRKGAGERPNPFSSSGGGGTSPASRSPAPVPSAAEPPPSIDYGDNPPDMLPGRQEYEIEWLGGYWKLPKDASDSDHLRDRIVSAARASGTAPARPAHLHEIYAGLGDSIQQLFGISDVSAAFLSQRYGSEPELAAYLIARLAVSMRDIGTCRQVMRLAESTLARAKEGPAKRCAESFVRRGQGVFEAMTPPGRWQPASEHFQLSLGCLPSNATSWYLQGMCSLELGRPEEAAEMMQRSLLLDLDFKAPYVNLGVVYLRLRKFDAAIEISEACLRRHPDSPQCSYHIGVGCYFLSAAMEDKAAGVVAAAIAPQLELQHLLELRKKGWEALSSARDSDEAKRLNLRRKYESPWLDEDDEMCRQLRPGAFESAMKYGSRSTAKQLTKHVALPPAIGWKFFGWRT